MLDHAVTCTNRFPQRSSFIKSRPSLAPCMVEKGVIKLHWHLNRNLISAIQGCDHHWGLLSCIFRILPH